MYRVTLFVLALSLGLAGCVTAQPESVSAPAPTVDPSGQWAGVWYGYGINDIPRREPVKLDIRQSAGRGVGRLVMENTNAADSVPPILRFGGLAGAPVRVLVAGNEVTLMHELGDPLFIVDLAAQSDDRMTGTVRDTYPPVRIALERVKPPAPPAPPRSEAPAPAPAPVVVAPPAAPPPTPPAPVASERPAPVTFGPVEELKSIYFEFDRADIRPGDAKVLEGNAQWLKSHRDAQLIVEGHCDERGTNEYNVALGERRARAARDYLVSQGVESARVTVISYGEDRPVCSEHTEACWSQNRRAEFKAKGQ